MEQINENRILYYELLSNSIVVFVYILTENLSQSKMEIFPTLARKICTINNNL